MRKAPSFRERLREAQKQIASHEAMIREMSRTILAILTEAEGEIEVSSKAFDEPRYRSTKVVVGDERVVITGLPAIAPEENGEG